MYVSKPAELEEAISILESSPVIAVDTEFLREKTYYAKLCLVQIGDEGSQYAIDPIALGDVSALGKLFANGEIVKLFHSGDQDIEILLRATGVVPTPVFDTQIAASILGIHQQIGYAALVKEVCGVSLAKADSLTDWSRRPLTKTQLAYALDDVKYLPQVYRHLHGELEAKGRLSWAEPDFKRLSDPATYIVDPMSAWKHVKRTSSLNRAQLCALQAVAAWREEEAQRRDIPKRWVISDEIAVEIARRLPKRPDDILTLRNISGRMSISTMRKLIARIQSALKADPSTWPRHGHRQASNVDCEAAVDLLTALAHSRARENCISASVLAPHDEIVRLAKGQRSGVSMLEGWRRALVGDDMLALLDGKLALSMSDNHLKVTDALQQGFSGE